jgi:cysteine desulfurase
LLSGGTQERRLRPGTEPVALIAGFAAAARLAIDGMREDLEHKRQLCERLWRALADIGGVRRNGSTTSHYPGILNVSVDGIEGESLMLELEPLCVASGSACNAQAGEASFVLRALGLGDLEAQSAIRFSFGRGTTETDVDLAAAIYRRAVRRLRRISMPASAA